MPHAVNPQIVDSCTSTSVQILGSGPGNALGSLFQATAQALSNAAHNASSAAQIASIVQQATAAQGVTSMYAIDTAAEAASITRILHAFPKKPHP